jgi:hypothetical protein
MGVVQGCVAWGNADVQDASAGGLEHEAMAWFFVNRDAAFDLQGEECACDGQDESFHNPLLRGGRRHAEFEDAVLPARRVRDVRRVSA